MADNQLVDDGASSHLVGATVPSIALPSTSGSPVNISELSGVTVIFGYPRTGNPNATPMPEDYHKIPGVKGCTPQACSFRDASDDLLSFGVSHVFGLSTQDTPYQQELKERTHLPYQLLSDEKLELIQALRLPTHEFEGGTFIKRFNMVVEDGKIIKVFYPVPEPSKSASDVLEWLKTRPSRQTIATETENEMMRNLQKK